MRKFRSTTALLLAAAFLCLPVGAASEPVIPDTWDGVMEIYGKADVIPLTYPIYLSQKTSWADVLGREELDGYSSLELTPYAADGEIIAEEAWKEDRPATGQHAIVIDTEKSNYALFELIIEGDVLGTGVLSIAQLVRLAQALNNSAPLRGVFAQAGDLNGDGSVGIADLVTLAQWIAGQYPDARTSLPRTLEALF